MYITHFRKTKQLWGVGNLGIIPKKSFLWGLPFIYSHIVNIGGKWGVEKKRHANPPPRCSYNYGGGTKKMAIVHEKDPTTPLEYWP